MLKEDTKIFYRNLGTKNIVAREPISMAELKPYWNNLCGEKAQLNKRSEWIRREESREMGNMDMGPIEIMKITSFFQYFKILNVLEIIKYKITGFMHFLLPTGILQKTAVQ